MPESLRSVLFLVALAVAIGISVNLDRTDPKHPRLILTPWRIILGVAILIVYRILAPSIGMVTTGERGVVLRFGAQTGRVLGEGLYVVTPISERVEIMSVQVEAFEAEADAASRDLQQVKTNVTLNYSLDPMRVGEIYGKLRQNYQERIIKPAVQEAVKGATAQFEAEKLIGQRDVVKSQIESSLKSRLEKYGIIMEGLSITDFSFSESFNQAIEAKAAAVQQAEKARRDLDRVRMEAEQKIAQARAEAESLRIQKGNVTAEMLKLRQVEVQKAAVDKWDGHMPSVVTGNNVPFIMNLPQ